jgi:hypothetical protein
MGLRRGRVVDQTVDRHAKTISNLTIPCITRCAESGEDPHIHSHFSGVQAMGFKIMKALFPSVEAECKAGDMKCITLYPYRCEAAHCSSKCLPV